MRGCGFQIQGPMCYTRRAKMLLGPCCFGLLVSLCHAASRAQSLLQAGAAFHLGLMLKQTAETGPLSEITVIFVVRLEEVLEYQQFEK